MAPRPWRRLRPTASSMPQRLALSWRFHQSTTRASWSTGFSRRAESADAIIINPAGYSFTSIAILDAIKAFDGPVIELHISNIHARDEYHRHSKISSVATAVICGLGPHGYIAAMHAITQMEKKG